MTLYLYCIVHDMAEFYAILLLLLLLWEIRGEEDVISQHIV